MKQIYGIWLPKDDIHFNEDMIHSNGDYQRDIFQAAISYIKEPKIFYDIGAHVGLWSLMAHRAGFKEIYAYEPNPDTYICLEKNLKNMPHAKIYMEGIGNIPIGYTKTMKIVKNSLQNSGAVSLVDSIEYCPQESAKICNISPNDIYKCIDRLKILPHQTLVKIDTEGMEADCVLGMDKIIYALRPVVCVEQRSNKDALDILQKMGMGIVQQIRKDYILTWK